MGCARNYLKTKCGEFFKVNSIRNALLPRMRNKGIYFSDVDKLLQYFKDFEDISFQVLWNVESDYIGHSDIDTVSDRTVEGRGKDLYYAAPKNLALYKMLGAP